jgi:hypothetical protein
MRPEKREEALARMRQRHAEDARLEKRAKAMRLRRPASAVPLDVAMRSCGVGELSQNTVGLALARLNQNVACALDQRVCVGGRQSPRLVRSQEERTNSG